MGQPGRRLARVTPPDRATFPSAGPCRELLHDRVRPQRAVTTTAMPLVKTLFYTLDISARFLLSCAIGRGSRSRCDELIDGYWRRIACTGNSRLFAEGRHYFDAVGGQCIVMSNHGSLLDIPSLMGAVPGSLRMVLKEELTRIPVWGQALVASGFIPINRSDRSKAIAQLEKAKEMVRSGITVWISPEGTRARNKMLAPFKRGGFHLAIDLGVPIIPAFIDGAQDILPPDRLLAMTEGEVVVRFGAPIATVDVPMAELMATVRAAILELSGRGQEIDGAPSGSVS
jgi:1-acyl-sn-glycerol-3-phosphate acyltransferase